MSADQGEEHRVDGLFEAVVGDGRGRAGDGGMSLWVSERLLMGSLRGGRPGSGIRPGDSYRNRRTA
ncbi:hypothetical protein VR45_18495 [Streptomyces sp. NRRL S-495]|nr:hypothetical protein VR45_18495 [Streptomyces sp. NRRL S-495]